MEFEAFRFVLESEIGWASFRFISAMVREGKRNLNVGASILYPNHMKNRAPNLPAKSFKTFFLAWEPIFLSSESRTIYKILQSYEFSLKTVCGASQTSKIQLFTWFFTHFLDPNFLRYGQDLYQAHTGHSRVSSLPIGLLYLQHPPSNFALQNFFEIFVRYSQSLYKAQIRKSWHHPSL